MDDADESLHAAHGLRWWSAATCVWSLAFAPHFYWAAGGRAGLGAEAGAADAALSQSWFAAYNLVVGVLALVGAVVAAMVVRPPGEWTLRVLRAAAWIACALLSLRGVIGLTALAFEAVRGAIDSPPMLVAIEPWFLLGGILFGVLAAKSRRRVEGS